MSSTSLAGTVALEEIHVETQRVGRAISPLLFGANHRYALNGFGMWDPGAGAPAPGFVDAYEKSGLTVVRFPGGRLANTYKWRRAIGPVAERRMNYHPNTGASLRNGFGPDEFGAFLDEVATTGTAVVNFTTGTAREAGDFVEYMNAQVGANPNGGTDWAQVRASNGHPLPYGIDLWEVGNELGAGVSPGYWMGRGNARERSEKYALGGTTVFNERPLGHRANFTASAGISTGNALQAFSVKYAPVVPGSDTVYVDGEPWSRVDDFENAGQSSVYRINPRSGRVRFGDGDNGRIPPAGAKITASYTSGPHDGFIDFYREMKESDPSISVGSAIHHFNFMRIMAEGSHPFDFLALHLYSGTPPADLPLEDFHDAVLQRPDERLLKVKEAREQLRATTPPGAGIPDIVVSEYGMFFRKWSGPTPNYLASIDQALYVALSLRNFMRLGIQVAEKHSLVDVDPTKDSPVGEPLGPATQAILGHAPTWHATATSRLFSLMTAMTGERMVRSRVLQDGGTPSGSSLRTIASTDDKGNLYLVVINVDGELATTASVAVDRPLPPTMRVWRLTGDDFTSFNTPSDPNEVRLWKATHEVADPLVMRFPPHSVTGIKVGQVED